MTTGDELSAYLQQRHVTQSEKVVDHQALTISRLLDIVAAQADIIAQRTDDSEAHVPTTWGGVVCPTKQTKRHR